MKRRRDAYEGGWAWILVSFGGWVMGVGDERVWDEEGGAVVVVVLEWRVRWWG